MSPPADCQKLAPPRVEAFPVTSASSLSAVAVAREGCMAVIDANGAENPEVFDADPSA